MTVIEHTKTPASGAIRLGILKAARAWAILLVCGLICACNFGCSTTVTPPYHPPHPAVVYLCDYGVHSSLLLPVGNGQFVEYLYGDWNWAALHHTGWLDALGAIFWSGQSTLGRRFITQLPGEKMPTPPDGAKTEVSLTVNGDGCREIENQLNLRWLKNVVTALLPLYPQSEMTFVKDDEPYSWLHDCNHLTADCLQKMGCKTDGCAIWSKFNIIDPIAPRTDMTKPSL